MASRYPTSSRLRQRQYGTAKGHKIVRDLVNRGTISYHTIALQESERLDIVAQRYYGNSSLWWVIAAASNIGWGLQVPAGTYLIVPKDINKIFNLLG